jgi:protein-disulfide isomerase
VLAVAGGVLVLVVVAIVLGVVLGGGSNGGGSNGGGTGSSWPTAALPQSSWMNGGTQTQQMLARIPQHGLTLGSPSAPVTMVEYFDLQCPYCDQFETQVFPNIVKRYVRTGKLKVVARPLDFLGPDSVRGRNALIAAAFQNKAFNFAAIDYANWQQENTGWLNDAFVKSDAESIPGMNPAKLGSERTAASVTKIGKASDASANKENVTGTPTILVGTSLGNVHLVTAPGSTQPMSPTDEATLVAAIKAALRS